MGSTRERALRTMDHLSASGHTVLQARMIGKTTTALVTFERLQMGHRSDQCPTTNHVPCKICGVDNPTSGLSCTPKLAVAVVITQPQTRAVLHATTYKQQVPLQVGHPGHGPSPGGARRVRPALVPIARRGLNRRLQRGLPLLKSPDHWPPQPAKPEPKKRAPPYGASGGKLGEEASSALTFLRYPVPNFSFSSAEEQNPDTSTPGKWRSNCRRLMLDSGPR
ncbi:hypothetical protein HPB50_015242 [Hyalomma asiaticum]|uniref:Uncharacterized protein n=1 Tax=Hyalomma asiaticum TaxID=266040 RepID=A0ACB7S190_HYAAI|nr:hypothetical protein HPB50_015242 [Hyalomma asiaticum]